MPARCISCGAQVYEHGNMCQTCFTDFEIIGSHHCKCCGLPFEFDMGDGAECKFCLAEKPKFKKVTAICKYTGTGRKLAVKLKFGDSTHLAPHMARLMASSAGEVLAKADLITSVPLHFRRKFGRKYNQAGLLARYVAKISGVEYSPFLLRRVRHTDRQTTLSRENRRKNVLDAFAVHEPDLKGKTILLIDDVMTTGATINECARVLKQAGAEKVYGLVFARVTREY